MHRALADRAKLKARSAELVLVGTSVIFLATTFSDDRLFKVLDLDPAISSVVLGIASAAAFFCSIAILLIDWAGAAALHNEAGDQFSRLLMKFRQCRLADDTWPSEIAEELSAAYEQASASSVSIPDKSFNSMKVQYLTKKEVSALASRHPGAPLLLLKLIVRFRASRSAWNEDST